MTSFAGKVVLISGSSSGVGAGTAIHFSRLGASVVVTGRNSENLQKVFDQCNEPRLAITGDLTKEEDVKNIIESTIKHFGRLDVLVNNAGLGVMGTIETATLQDLDRSFNLNVRSVYQLTQLAVPHLIKTKGNIVNVSSIAGVRAFPGSLPYCIAKAGLDHFTRCVALELADKQVRVNSVNPGTVETSFHRSAGMSEEQIRNHYQRGKVAHPLGRTGEVEEMASAIAYLASDAASFVTGVILSVDGGKHATTAR